MVIGFKTNVTSNPVYPDSTQQKMPYFMAVRQELTGDVFVHSNSAGNISSRKPLNNKRLSIIFGMWKKYEEHEFVVGKARITELKTETSPEKSVEAVIKRCSGRTADGGEMYRMYVNNRPVGTASFVEVKAGDGEYGVFKSGDRPGFIEMMSLKSFEQDKYKEIGTAFVQFAVEESLKKGFGGKVQVFAGDIGEGSPVGFYFKNGFISRNPEIPDGKIQEELDKAKAEGREPASISINSLDMYLPESRITFWAEKIKQSPILYKED